MDRGEAWSPNEGLRGFKELEMLERFSDKDQKSFTKLETDGSIPYKHMNLHKSEHNMQLVSFGGTVCGAMFWETNPTHYNLIAKF